MKKKSIKFFNFVSNENGSAIVIALLVLLALSIVGIGTITISQFETQVATNDILNKKAFYAADGGVALTQEMIEENLSCPLGFPTTAPGITGLQHLPFEQRENFLRVTDLDFAYQVTDDIDTDADNDINEAGEGIPAVNNKDLWFGDNFYNFNDYDTDNDGEVNNLLDNLERPHTSVVAFGDPLLSTGSAIQMAAGYEGTGYGTAGGGGRIVYQIHSRHQNSLRNSIAYIIVNYRHLIGQEGNCQFNL